MIARFKRSLWAGGIAIAALAVIVGVGALTVNVQADQGGGRGSNHETKSKEKKVWVCKYVGTPGVNERLKSGKNPISTSVNSIEHNQWDGSIPGWFSDKHDRSFVLAYDGDNKQPDISNCYLKDAKVNITVTDATCTSGQVLIHSGVNATLKSGSTPSGTTGPAHYSVTYNAIQDHLFLNSQKSSTESGYLSGKLLPQITSSKKPCYAPKPSHKPEVVWRGDWKDDGHVKCSRDSVKQTRTIKTKYYTYSWNERTHAWEESTKTKTSTETRYRDLTEAEKAHCTPQADPTLALAEVGYTDATCEAGQTLVYGSLVRATVEAGSTPEGATGHYKVTFKADAGSFFDLTTKSTELVIEGDLAGPTVDDPSCEDGDVLGDTDTEDPADPADVAAGGVAVPVQLPHTASDATTVVTWGGGLIAVVAGLAGARRLFGRNL